MKETPKISIVTVTYNCKATVEKAIQNVLKQTYPNLEYIVIDGGSTDGTKEIIERYADRLAHFVGTRQGHLRRHEQRHTGSYRRVDSLQKCR